MKVSNYAENQEKREPKINKVYLLAIKCSTKEQEISLMKAIKEQNIKIKSSL
jgi:hypothetical protein